MCMKIETNRNAGSKSNGKLLPGIFLRISVVDFPISLLAAVVEFSSWPWNYERSSFPIFCYFSASHSVSFFCYFCSLVSWHPDACFSSYFVRFYFRSFCFGLIKSKVFHGFSLYCYGYSILKGDSYIIHLCFYFHPGAVFKSGLDDIF